MGSRLSQRVECGGWLSGGTFVVARSSSHAQGLQRYRLNHLSASTMADRKSKGSKQIQAEAGELRERVEAQGSEMATLRRRVDRLEKSTHLVFENSETVESLFAKAEATREFKNLASETAMAILRELHVLTNLPVPLSEVPPETWHASFDTNANVDFDATVSSWGWALALLFSSRFVAPNKTWSKRDETTGEWKRAPGHFVIRLGFGEASLRVQQGLQGSLGQWIGKAVKAAREKGEASFNLYSDKTPEELERKCKRTGGEMGTTSMGRGGGKGKDRKKNKGKGGKGGASRGGEGPDGGRRSEDCGQRRV